ncbi:MAG: nucleotide exchange factor GrpE [Sedimentisphaerales bacterium]|jgi:molecular chaperone GrpE (heat shock protein)
MADENTHNNCTQEGAQGVPVPPADSVSPLDAGPSLNVLYRGYKLISRLLRRQHEQFGELTASVQRQTIGFEQCLNTVKNCQEQTAKILNQEFDRHALNPAIESVVLLANELERLHGLAAQLIGDGLACAKVQKLIDDLAVSGQIAQDRLRYLDIEKIAPSLNDCFDPKLHTVCSYSDTDDSSRSGCISEMITAGIIYRGKVLRQARVSVFRHKQ